MSRQRPNRQRRRDGDVDAATLDRAARAAAAAAARAAEEAERRFARAAGDDAARGGAPGDEVVLRQLRSSAIVGMARVVYSSNAVFLLELEEKDPHRPDQPLRAIYKPARGERPLWDFPRHTLHLRETAAYLVSAALGDGLVPPTTLRSGPYGPGSVQLFVHASADGELDARHAQQIAELAALDVLINNADRKRAHLLVSQDGRLFGIDNALSFLPYPRQRTVLIDLGGSPLPRAVAGRVEALAGDGARRQQLQACLAPLLDGAECTAFADRLDSLAAVGRYPLLDPWDGRPFEWW